MRDAEAIKIKLESAGVEVLYVTNVDIRQLRAEVKKYEQTLQKGDVALIYFAGHGCEFNNAPRLLAKSLGTESDVKEDSLNVLVLLDRFDSQKNWVCIRPNKIHAVSKFQIKSARNKDQCGDPRLLQAFQVFH